MTQRGSLTNSANAIARVLSWLLVSAGAMSCSSDRPAPMAAGPNEPDAQTAGSDAGGGGMAGSGAGNGGSDGAAPCPEPTTTAPTDVFCIGLYEGRDPSRIVTSAQPYTPGVVLWSDGAEKRRYLSVPPSTQIDTSNMDVWKFPVGTKAFKEFLIDGKLVETRMFWKQAASNWIAVTYVWNADGSAATLNTSKKPLLLENGYEIPTAKDCGRCHHGGADKLLGVEAIALALPAARGMTLASLAQAKLLSDPPETTSIELPEDSTGKAAAALGYLHANCGMPCHSSRGLGDETNLLLRLHADEFWPSADADAGAPAGPAEVTSTDTYVASVNKKPTTASVAQKFPDAFRITPGAHDRSLLWLLSHRRDMYQMPPLVSHRIDDVGTQALADWIDALQP